MNTPVAEIMTPQGVGTEVSDDTANLQPFDWADAERHLNSNGYCWLATVRPDGWPHVMPLFAVWSESNLFVASKDTARKSRNLTADGRCALTADTGELHLVIEGVGTRVRDQSELKRASRTFETVYGWPTTVSGDQLDAPYGAPTSGGPPYAVFDIRPSKAFALPTEGAFLPTRWRFT